jgi:hypothetical protein
MIEGLKPYKEKGQAVPIRDIETARDRMHNWQKREKQ